MTSLWSLSFLALASLATAAGLSPAYNPRAVKAIPHASHVIQLATKVTRPAFKRNTLTRSCGSQTISSLAGVFGGTEYGINATIGGQEFTLALDTGSSDLWVPTANFSCFNLADQPVPRGTCGFGSTFDPAKSKTFKPYNDKNFNISYVGGQSLTGSVGFDTVNVGGVEVFNQEFGLVDKASWQGDNITSGILGLAAPGLTSVYNGTDPDNDTLPESYLPFFYNAVAGKKSKPFFSISLNRPASYNNISGPEPNLGLIAFGGVAPVPTRSPNVTVPSLKLQSKTQGLQYFFWVPEIDALKFPGSSSLNTSSNSTILDTGTTLNYFPSDIAKQYNAKFEPAAKVDDEYGIYVVACSAKAPDFQVMIGGKDFHINTKDQLVPIGVKNDQGEDLCASGMQDAGPGLPVLGQVFLHNVVMSLNIQDETITLHQRAEY